MIPIYEWLLFGLCRRWSPFKNFDRLGHWIAAPRFHHWHHGLEREASDVNFAIHFPWLDKLFGTFHLPPGRCAENYGIPEAVPRGYLGQFAYPWTRTGEKTDG